MLCIAGMVFHIAWSQEIFFLLDKVIIFKLRLGALMHRSVSLSVCLSVLQKLQKNFTKHYKTLYNVTKH